MNIDEKNKYNNLFNIETEDLNLSIYRIIPVSTLEKMLIHSTNALVKVSSWDDVYENFFFKQSFFLDNEFPLIIKGIGDCFFGQCWSKHRDSDAMWRIYSSKKDSVRIKTTIRKLYDSVYIDNDCWETTHIGAVKYKTQEELKYWLDSCNGLNPDDTESFNRLMTKSVFIKRDPFIHEQEIRVTYECASNELIANRDKKIYNINVNEFIEEITFDPRVEDDYMNNTRDMISSHNYPMEKVNKSPLYEFIPKNIMLR